MVERVAEDVVLVSHELDDGGHETAKGFMQVQPPRILKGGATTEELDGVQLVVKRRPYHLDHRSPCRPHAAVS